MITGSLDRFAELLADLERNVRRTGWLSLIAAGTGVGFFALFAAWGAWTAAYVFGGIESAVALAAFGFWLWGRRQIRGFRSELTLFNSL